MNIFRTLKWVEINIGQDSNRESAEENDYPDEEEEEEYNDDEFKQGDNEYEEYNDEGAKRIRKSKKKNMFTESLHGIQLVD